MPRIFQVRAAGMAADGDTFCRSNAVLFHKSTRHDAGYDLGLRYFHLSDTIWITKGSRAIALLPLLIGCPIQSSKEA